MPLSKIQFQPGVVSELTDYAVGNGWIDSNLIRFRLGKPAVIGGWKAVGPPGITGVCREMVEWSSNSGNVRLGLGSNTGAWIFQDDVYYNITPAGFTPGKANAGLADGYGVGLYGVGTYGTPRVQVDDPLTETTSQPLLWSMDNFGEDLILNPRGGPIYIWKANLNFPAVLLSNEPVATSVPQLSNQIFVHKRSQSVIALGCVPYGATDLDPMQIRWSSSQNPFDWFPTSANSAGGQRLASGSYIIGHFDTYYETLIWTDRTVYSMQLQGNGFVYGFQVLGSGLSIISPKAAMGNGSSVFWMDRGSFYVYSGSIQELPCPLKREIFGNINLLQAWKVHASHNHSFSEVTWFYPSKNSVEIDSYATYNYRDNLWSKGMLQRTAWSDSGRLSTPVGIDASGKLYLHEIGDTADGSPMPYYLTSGDLDADGGDQFLMIQRLLADFRFTGSAGNNQTVAIDYRTRDTSTQTPRVVKTSYATPLPSNNGYIDARVRGRRLSINIRNSGVAGTAWTMGSFEANVSQNGRR